MLIVADGGSTKTEWRIVDDSGSIRQMRTSGYNPYILKQDEMTALMDKEIDADIERMHVDRVYFYGSGCSGGKANTIVKNALTSTFPGAQIDVNHDLLGAARALCGDQPGIASILGTGSNSCLYDGRSIRDNIPSLGYIAGDEGSGSHLGKLLLKAFYYRTMPQAFTDEFRNMLGGNRETVLDRIYRQSFPNRFLASLSELLSRHPGDAFCDAILQQAFGEFVTGQLKKYENWRSMKMHFTGSVAYHYANVLTHVLQAEGCMPGTITQSPVAGLLLYHQKGH